MTPKEKAKELFNKIGKSISKPLKSGGYRFNIETCKQCALIAVDEIITSVSMCYSEDSVINYWKEVKQEIELL